MLRFGLPTVPAEVSVFALFFVDRLWLLPLRERRRRPACTRSRSSSPASSSFTVRAFQYAWPPLAYSIEDDEEAAPRLRAHHDLLRAVHRARRRRPGAARPLARAAASPRRSSSPRTRRCRGSRSAGRCTACSSCWWRWPGRAQVTIRNAPAALCGLVVNVALLAAARAAAGDRRRRPRARRRLRRDARRDVGADPQPVPGRRSSGAGWRCFVARRRRARASRGELLLPTRGVGGLRHPRARARRDPARALRRAASSGPASSRGRARPAQARRSGSPAARLNSSAASARPSPRRGNSVARDVLDVALRVVARAGRARPSARSAVRPGRQAAHEQRRGGASGACACSGRGCARTRRSAASGTLPVESCSWWTARALGHVERVPAGVGEPPAEVDLVGVDEELRVEVADLLGRRAAHEHRRRLHPVDRRARRRRVLCTTSGGAATARSAARSPGRGSATPTAAASPSGRTSIAPAAPAALVGGERGVQRDASRPARARSPR